MNEDRRFASNSKSTPFKGRMIETPSASDVDSFDDLGFGGWLYLDCLLMNGKCLSYAQCRGGAYPMYWPNKLKPNMKQYQVTST